MLITLLTDYGHFDTYVGQLKGAILAISANARLVDLTHEVPPQNVRAGAFFLWSAVEIFAKGSVHLAVVDPGVGSDRRTIALRARRGDLFVGPDNGLLVPAVERLGGVDKIVVLDDERYWASKRSATFHGRDLFGPVAAHLSMGVPLEKVGTVVSDLDRSISFATPKVTGGRWVGEVLHVDRFGNLVTSFPSATLPARFKARVGALSIDNGPHPFFAAVPEGSPLAVAGSYGLLELCVRDRNAASQAGVKAGASVELWPI